MSLCVVDCEGCGRSEGEAETRRPGRDRQLRHHQVIIPHQISDVDPDPGSASTFVRIRIQEVSHNADPEPRY